MVEYKKKFLAKRGIKTIGIDYVLANIKKAESDLLGEKNSELLKYISFEEADCRTYINDTKADLVLCLYDVIGSFASDVDNKNIIKTAYDLLKADGVAVFSVMNYITTLVHAENTFVFDDDPNKLLELLPSSIMETSGNVYDPKFYYVDTTTRMVYRKEQFTAGNDLPVELIVRDRRFSKEEIISFCEEIGFNIIEAKYTNASGWDQEYPADSKRAKEILIICRK